jgi:hypothetical protein
VEPKAKWDRAPRDDPDVFDRSGPNWIEVPVPGYLAALIFEGFTLLTEFGWVYSAPSAKRAMVSSQERTSPSGSRSARCWGAIRSTAWMLSQALSRRRLGARALSESEGRRP